MNEHRVFPPVPSELPLEEVVAQIKKMVQEVHLGHLSYADIERIILSWEEQKAELEYLRSQLKECS